MSRAAGIALLPMGVLVIAGLAAPLSLVDLPGGTGAEARAALYALDVFERGNWILPLEAGMRGAPVPPLLAWLQAALGALIGLGALALRLPSGLAALAAAWLAFRLAEDRAGPGMGVPAAWMLAACPLLATAAVTPASDMALAAAVSLSLLGMSRAEQGRGGAAAFHAGLAVSLLCKGPVGPLLLGCALPAFAHTRAGRAGLVSLWRSSWAGLLAVPLLWLLLAYLVGESIFLNDAIGVFADALRGTAGGGSSSNALASLLRGGAPWSWLGLAGAVVAISRAGAARSLAGAFALMLAGVAIARTQEPVYVLPLLPTACVLAAFLLRAAARSDAAARRLAMAACLGAAALVGFHVVGIADAARQDPDASLRALAATVRAEEANGAWIALYGDVPDAFRFYARQNVPARRDPELGWYFARARPGRPALLVAPASEEDGLRARFAGRGAGLVRRAAQGESGPPQRLLVLELAAPNGSEPPADATLRR